MDASETGFDAQALALLQLLSGQPELSLQRVRKRLGISTSELQRLLSELGGSAAHPGLGLVQSRAIDGRTVLMLSARGRSVCDCE